MEISHKAIFQIEYGLFGYCYIYQVENGGYALYKMYYEEALVAYQLNKLLFF